MGYFLVGIGSSFVGIALGLLAMWLFAREKSVAAFEAGRATIMLDKIAIDEKLKAKEERVAQLESEMGELNLTIDGLRMKIEALGQKANLADERESLLRAEKENTSRLENKIDVLTQNLSDSNQKLSSQEAKLESQVKSEEQKLALLMQAKEELTAKFQRVASDLFDAKSATFNEQTKSTLDLILKPLGEKLKDFEKKVEDTYGNESRERIGLQQEIKNLHELNTTIGVEATNLTKALKGETKTLGNWGEFILETVLEKSGLRKGEEYDTQSGLTDDEGKKAIPDVVINLPERRHVIVDSKVSLLAYERYSSATTDAEREVALKQHLQSVRKHIADLNGKRYQNLAGVKTPDLVLMFVPIEPSFALVVQHDPDLFHEGYENNVMLVSPTTLLATLRTVATIWRSERQNVNAKEIARQAGGLYDKFVGFISDLELVGTRLGSTQSSLTEAFSKLRNGKGNLIARAEKIRTLGVKTTKQLPTAFTGIDEDEDLPEVLALPNIEV